MLASLVVHEFSHALVADLLGDHTARLEGRLTLNPLAHLQLVGLLLMLFGPIGFAKPVPFNPSNLKHRRLGTILVAAAGPFSNFLLALIALIIWQWVLFDPYSMLGQIIELIALVNVSLCLFNLIPIPPLDGSQILRNLFPDSTQKWFYKLDFYGPFILIILFLIPSVIDNFYIPLINEIVGLLSQAVARL
ncbi:site-2 protease family protein [Alicyclobacillus tolerans]|uniref:Zn-dependent protease (Includes SpoIVFB) n=1 Tax=Alicyclobacillus tolerans TaxID=90970 RepID=A0A1M6SBM2_9BACL|nr:site-2 protease family protein [Alicyclobacillus montanus]QRF23299.1 site-2 protease family protein [Alicyclobacillus sp. TC]SHK42153.1 Zn-dependent protease (includes SpoIVFB) [Alicyclobacillus montanus]